MTSVRGKKSSWNQNAYLSDTEEKAICVRHIRETVQDLLSLPPPRCQCRYQLLSPAAHAPALLAAALTLLLF